MSDRSMRRFGVADRDLELYLAGEAGAETAERIESASRDSSELRAYLEQRRNANVAFLEQYPTLDPTPSVPLLRRRRVLGALSLAVAAAAILVFVPPQTSNDRAKGAFALQVIVTRGEKAFEHRDGIPLHPGDRLSLSVASPQGGYATVVGRTNDGPHAILYSRVHVQAGNGTLPGSLEVDNVGGTEELLVLFSDRPLADSAALDHAGGREQPDVSSQRIVFEKVAQP